MWILGLKGLRAHMCFQFFFIICIGKLIREGNLGLQICYIWPSLGHKFVLDSKEFLLQVILTLAFSP